MNLMTNAMEKLTKMLVNTDSKLKGYATEPYATKKLTPGEQREKIKNMTSGELLALINERGIDAVNEWLNKYWREDNG